MDLVDTNINTKSFDNNNTDNNNNSRSNSISINQANNNNPYYDIAWNFLNSENTIDFDNYPDNLPINFDSISNMDSTTPDTQNTLESSTTADSIVNTDFTTNSPDDTNMNTNNNSSSNNDSNNVVNNLSCSSDASVAGSSSCGSSVAATTSDDSNNSNVNSGGSNNNKSKINSRRSGSLPTVCGECKLRKRACDLQKPSCSRCIQYNKPCIYPVHPPSAMVNAKPRANRKKNLYSLGSSPSYGNFTIAPDNNNNTHTIVPSPNTVYRNVYNSINDMLLSAKTTPIDINHLLQTSVTNYLNNQQQNQTQNNDNNNNNNNNNTNNNNACGVMKTESVGYCGDNGGANSIDLNVLQSQQKYFQSNKKTLKRNYESLTDQTIPHNFNKNNHNNPNDNNNNPPDAQRPKLNNNSNDVSPTSPSPASVLAFIND